MKYSLFFLLFLATLFGPHHDLFGQHVGVAVGPAFPRGSLADSRNVGFRAAGLIGTSNDLFRIEVSYVYLAEGDSTGGSDWRRGAWQTRSIGASVRPTIVSSPPYRLRGVIGIAAHRTTITNVRGPYGTVPGIHFGFTMERPIGSFRGVVETGIHAVLSDFGVDEFTSASYIPLTLGVLWPLGR